MMNGLQGQWSVNDKDIFATWLNMCISFLKNGWLNQTVSLETLAHDCLHIIISLVFAVSYIIFLNVNGNLSNHYFDNYWLSFYSLQGAPCARCNGMSKSSKTKLVKTWSPQGTCHRSVETVQVTDSN